MRSFFRTTFINETEQSFLVVWNHRGWFGFGSRFLFYWLFCCWFLVVIHENCFLYTLLFDAGLYKFVYELFGDILLEDVDYD